MNIDPTMYEQRCAIAGQPGLVIWLTGLSGAGKSSIAQVLERRLLEEKKLVYRLDGDMLRTGLNSDLGFSKQDRDENIRRIAEVAAILQDAGIIVLVSAISPYQAMRDYARKRIRENCYVEVYVYADLATCKERDPKGLYEKAMRGEIPDFTGVSAPYEEPLSPELTIDTTLMSIEDSAEKVLALVRPKITREKF
ncbi:MAG: adenylyl-sulfate kinase [Spirochaetales bacterium]|nr:MAG: adenylyl-sulfate kinase [Spirochaetales bacterium]